jgi:small GTP-binding protein
MTRILSPEQARLLGEEREVLEHLLERLSGWDAAPEDVRRLHDALDGLAELFLLVVAGEFNAGKSALINALLGERLLEEGVTPTTQEVQVLAFGEPGPAVRADGHWRRTLAAPLLEEMHIVDTPGTNAIRREHEALTREFVPRADLVLFVTSADRPFTESERAFLAAIRAWGKKIVFVVNKVDLLETEAEREEVRTFVHDAARRLLDEPEPVVFALSARRALRAMESADDDALAASGWPAFAAWLKGTLTARERLRLKLESPLGVAERVADEAEREAEARMAVLRADRATLDEIDRAMALYASDMREQFDRRLDRVDNAILELRERGEAFLEAQFRIGRIRSLLDSEGLRRAFEGEVIADAPERIAAEVDGLVDWIVDREHRQWNTVRDRLTERASSTALRDAARARGPGGEFAARRSALLGSVGRQADAAISSFNAASESARLVGDVQEALASTALVEVGALGLGIVLKALLASAVADATGVLFAGMLAAFGLTIIPYRRRRAAEQLRDRTRELRETMRQDLGAAFEAELDASTDRMTGAVEPYGRFVRSELAELEALRAALAASRAELASLRPRIALVTQA